MSAIDFLRVLVIITILVFLSLSAVLGVTIPWFLLASVTLVFLALVNLVDVRSSDTAEWRQYS
ncbi:MAG: hypothetical protein ACFFF4_13030, partial [Candidatus Thorarchaeota archaeon]